jgi:hypothetical protein
MASKSVDMAGKKYHLIAATFFSDLLRRSKLFDSPQLQKTMQLDRKREAMPVKQRSDITNYDTAMKKRKVTKDFLAEKERVPELSGFREVPQLKGISSDRIDVSSSTSPTAVKQAISPDSTVASATAPAPVHPEESTVELEKEEQTPETSVIQSPPKPFSARSLIVSFKSQSPQKLLAAERILRSLERTKLIKWSGENGSIRFANDERIPESNIMELIATFTSNSLKPGEQTDKAKPGLSKVVEALAHDSEFLPDYTPNVTLKNAITRIRKEETKTRASSRVQPPSPKSILKKLSETGKGNKHGPAMTMKKWRRLV